MILIIDNYDSFTFNLVQYLGELRSDIVVARNDRITVGEIRELGPEAIVLSPGPGAPGDAGICNSVIQELGARIPMLGICLGHQCIAQVHGGRVERAPRIMHGKTSRIYHTGHPLFLDVPSPFRATRYHSLIVPQEGLPVELEIIARTSAGEIMGIKHSEHPTYGLQFHPESILTESGTQILKNFVALTCPSA